MGHKKILVCTESSRSQGTEKSTSWYYCTKIKSSFREVFLKNKIKLNHNNIRHHNLAGLWKGTVPLHLTSRNAEGLSPFWATTVRNRCVNWRVKNKKKTVTYKKGLLQFCFCKKDLEKMDECGNHNTIIKELQIEWVIHLGWGQFKLTHLTERLDIWKNMTGKKRYKLSKGVTDSFTWELLGQRSC